ncbi:hypothetical protein NE453_05720 [Holdemania filiformis]|nr:hypothetical protein [Holdemania filiformis]
MGPTGATGATGAGGGGGLLYYGGRYNKTEQTLYLNPNTPTIIPLPLLMPSNGVGTGTPDSLTIEHPGVYEINYMFNGSSSLGTEVSLEVRRNGIAIDSTEVTHLLAVGVESIYSGSVIEYLSPGDVLELVVFANYALNLTLGIGVAATLTVKKLDLEFADAE